MQRVNFQPISKIDHTNGSSLLIHSIFFTIQGEGPNVGMPAVFVRLGGCNLQCPGCDTEYTSGSHREPVESIVTRVGMAFGNYKGERLVVITGGEPFRQNLIPFIKALMRTTGDLVQVETNGTLGFQDETLSIAYRNRFQIVVSPKAGKVNMELHPFIVAYKYVLDANHIDPRDGLPESVLGMPAAPARPHMLYRGPVYVQPADEIKGNFFDQDESEGLFRNDRNLKATIGSAMKFGYRLCLQTHKIAGLE